MPYRRRKFYKTCNKQTILIFERVRVALLLFHEDVHERSTENFVEYSIRQIPFCHMRFPKTEIVIMIDAEQETDELIMREIGILRYKFLLKRMSAIHDAANHVGRSYNRIIKHNSLQVPQLTFPRPLSKRELNAMVDSSPVEKNDNTLSWLTTCSPKTPLSNLISPKALYLIKSTDMSQYYIYKTSQILHSQKPPSQRPQQNQLVSSRLETSTSGLVPPEHFSRPEQLSPWTLKIIKPDGESLQHQIYQLEELLAHLTLSSITEAQSLDYDLFIDTLEGFKTTD